MGMSTATKSIIMLVSMWGYNWYVAIILNQKPGINGKMIVTEDICAIWYEDEYIVSAEEICDKRGVGGNNPLFVCRDFFDMNIEIHCLGGCTNQNQKKYQDNTTKRKQPQ